MYQNPVKMVRERVLLERVSLNENMKFECQFCNKCHKLPVFVFVDEIKRYPVLAQNSHPCIFSKDFRELNRKGTSCFFLENHRCRIYAQRPFVCRMYPFYLDPLTHQLFVDKSCLGLGKGRRISQLELHKMNGSWIEFWEKVSLDPREGKLISEELFPACHSFTQLKG